MHWYQMEGLYLWTKPQHARIEGEGLAYQRLASLRSSEHLAACRRVKNSSLIFNKHVVTLMPKDPSLTHCEKAIPEPHIQVSIRSCIRSGYKSEHQLPWTRLLIDNLPCRGAPCFPTRSITLVGHTFLSQFPTSEYQHIVALPRLSREVPASLTPMAQGSGPIAHCTPARCEGGRKQT